MGFKKCSRCRLNKVEIQKSRQSKRKIDHMYRLSSNLRTRLWHAINANRWEKNTHFADYIGCSIEDLKKHLETRLQPGMTWENYGKWHVDHIKPLSSACDVNELYTLSHYSNLQPLWAEDNIRKGSIYGS